MKSIHLFLLLAFLTVQGFSQETLTGTIRGRVVDKVIQQGLPAATVMVIGSDPILGASADMEGYFEIKDVPAGRVAIKVSYLGYEPIEMQDLRLSSSKDLVLELKMQESLISLDAVEIVAEENKAEAINKMATVSARTFSVEEAERYAGARADVARMASNFAGVRGANDATNDIVIRGNSSAGLLWRFNGVDIPNPNHFGDLGATGGPVSMLNSNVLSNSDFFTAAFPSEYGNATSGVFDLKMRNGNDQAHEFLGQVGFNGFELGAEGPISRDRHSSYLVNARYSTLDVLQRLGMSVGTGSAVPEYQDVTFNVNLPNPRFGTVQIFGLAGNSAIDLLGSEVDTSAADVLYGGDNLDVYDRNQMAVGGINYRKTLGSNAYANITLAYTYFRAREVVDTVNTLTRKPCDCDWYLEDERNDKIFAHAYIAQKFNAKHNVKYGVIASQKMFDMRAEVRQASDAYLSTSDASGSTQLLQGYAQWQWRPTPRLTVNPGVHGQYLALNDDWSVEPRIGARFQLTEKQNLNAGYGLHAMMLPMQLLFYKKRTAGGELEAVNQDLGFTRSHHAVVGHDFQFAPNWRLKTEVYYQRLYDVPVSDVPTALSVLNFPSQPNSFPDWAEHYVNEGQGENYGVEFTLERFLANGWYGLTTLSIYESKYLASDGVWRSSAWDGEYVLNMLGGKEWELNANKPARKSQLYLTSDLKMTFAGGQPTVPIDLEASREAGNGVYDLTKGYSEKLQDYFRLDINVGVKQLGKRATQEWFIITQNITNRENPFFQQYDALSGELRTVNQLGFFIVPTYRITF